MEVSGSRHLQTTSLVTPSRSRLPERTIPSPARRRSPSRYMNTNDARQSTAGHDQRRGRSEVRESRADDNQTDAVISLMGFSAIDPVESDKSVVSGSISQRRRLESRHRINTTSGYDRLLHERPNR